MAGPVTNAIRAPQAEHDPLHSGIERLLRHDAPEPHRDAHLLDLWRRRNEALAAERAAGARLDAITDAMVLPEEPEAIFLREGDEALKLSGYAVQREGGRPWYPFEAADAERRGWRRRHFRDVRREVRPEDNLPPDATGIWNRLPWPEAQARADEIAAAWDDHRAEKEAVKEASGHDAANDEWEARDDDLAAIDGAIRDATAHTLAGLCIKARCVQIDDERDLPPDERLIAGLARDILALGGTP